MSSRTRKSKNDIVRTVYMMTDLLEIPKAELRGGHPVSWALAENGILGFNGDFTILKNSDIASLSYVDPTNGQTRKLAIPDVRRLMQVHSCFHCLSRINGAMIEIRDLSKVDFKQYVMDEYDINEEVIPWNQSLDKKQQHEMMLAWKRSIKPNRSDFKTFKAASEYTRYEKHFENVCRSQGLFHLIDPDHTVIDEDLENSQNQWLYHTIVEKFQETNARAIVRQHEVQYIYYR